jgi:hypothetical protein
MRVPVALVTGAIAAGALVVPLAQAKPPVPNPNDIPDPSTVPTLTPIPTYAVEPPVPGEPPDDDGGDDIAETPTPDPVATAVPTQAPTVIATATATQSPAEPPVGVPEAAATAEPIVTATAVATEVATGTPAGQQTPVATPVPPALHGGQPVVLHAPQRRAKPDVRRRHVRTRRRSPRSQRTGDLSSDGPRTPLDSGNVTEPSRVIAVRTRTGTHRLGRRVHLIQHGECLSVIAEHYGLDWHRLAAINAIPGPRYLIFAGERLILD